MAQEEEEEAVAVVPQVPPALLWPPTGARVPAQEAQAALEQLQEVRMALQPSSRLQPAAAAARAPRRAVRRPLLAAAQHQARVLWPQELPEAELEDSAALRSQVVPPVLPESEGLVAVRGSESVLEVRLLALKRAAEAGHLRVRFRGTQQ